MSSLGRGLALGADPAGVRGLIIRRCAMVAVAGVAIGTVLGLLLTRILASMLNDVNPTDPSVFLANAATVVAASMAACYVRARAAGRVDPGRVLRNE